LFDVADSKAASVLTFEEFQAFRELLSRPDGDLQLVLRLFAPQQQSQQEQQLPSLPLSHVKQVLREHTGASTSQNNVEVDLDAPILAAFVDDRKSQSLSAASFVELIRAIPAERLRQMFTRADSSQSGSISPSDFRALAKAVAADKIADEALDNALPRLVEPASSGISFATATAFFNVVRAIDQVELIARVAAEQSEDGASLDRADFANVALRMARTGVPAFSPLEIEVLFAVASPAGSERLQLADLRNSLHPSLRYRHPTPSTSADKPQIAGVAAAAVKKYKDDPRSALVEMLFQAYTFGLGAIGGAFGATVVYPIDLVKTRMQNQRSAVVGEVMYKNSIDCFRKVVRNEGLRGLYSGLLPQLVGVAPEKAIKLTMNDLVRSKFRDPQTGEIKVWAEILAGCTAGGSQVVFTNPLEIVKIRLQVQGEKMGLTKSLEGAPRRSAISIVRELGLLGLYKGAGACLLRDIPFSGIYFPVYAHLKKDVFHEGKDGKRLGMGELLLSGAIAGMPAAYLVTPADVIKTRLQVEARKGQATYSGIVDAARKIYAQEGASAFFKGGVARVLRSSPQFACTLMMYEVLQKTFPFPGTA
ncbi:mitochondrial carrier, partial [Ramicandelaber brevisporus]